MLPLPSSVIHRAQAARLTALCAAFALSGCAAIKQASLRDTEVFYRASTLDVYAPKPATVEIPILNAMPPRSKSIGSFRYTSKKGSQFAMDAAVYNARRVGADAVIGQTVIGREQQQARGIKLGLQCFLYLADLGHECLEPPERSLRFGQLVEPRKGCTAPRTSRGGRLAHRAAYRSARCHSRPGCA